MRRPGARGFALMATLWLLVAISAVTLEMGLSGRLLRTAAANRVEHLRAAAVAEAGIQRAKAALAQRLRGVEAPSSLDPTDPWADAGAWVPRTGELSDGGRYQVTARDLGARLNLNRAGELELRRFLAALAVDDARAARIAQAIMDWRDSDDSRRARGAERAEYLEAGAATLPSNGPFERVEDLRDVMGMTADIYDLVAPLVTVAGSGQVNLASAPVPVLAALPGMEPALVRAVLERRRRGPIGSVTDVALALPAAERAAFEAHLPELLSRTTGLTREIELISDGWYESGLTRVRSVAVAVRAGSGASGVFLFRRGGA